MSSEVPIVKLNNDQEIPILGLGTWKSSPGEVTDAVKYAIDAGYRHIDCAALYQNENEVGEGIRAKIDEGVVSREELFITSKLWSNSHSKQTVLPALKKTLSDLGLDYLDLYLIHNPVALQEGESFLPTDEDGSPIYSDVDYVETWEAMEELVALGLTKSIGVSSFNVKQLDRLMKLAKIPPVINQIEVSPYLTNVELVDFCSSKGVIVTGFGCFGSTPIESPGGDIAQPQILEEEHLKRLAEKYNKSVAQVILRWAIQRNIVVIPKSVTKTRIEDNIHVFDFTLTSDEMKQINTLNRNTRTVTGLWAKTHKYFPFPRIPNIKLNNGREMPIIGLGTWKSQPGEVTNAVKYAIDTGYRHIDCATYYQNENEVGEGIRAKIDEGVVSREELFITSKLWCTSHSRQAVLPALKKSLSDLGLDFLDLYLMHYPMGLQEGGELLPKDEDEHIIYSDIDYLETWEAMEELVALGLTKSIGVSNFNAEQLDRLLKEAKISPVVNQIEVSPYLSNVQLVDFCASQGLDVTGFSSFGSSSKGTPRSDQPQNILDDETLQGIAENYSKSVAQVILRWVIQRNITAIPKSVTKKRIEENIDIFDFTLTLEDMEKINGLNRNSRTVTVELVKDHKYYPWG